MSGTASFARRTAAISSRRRAISASSAARLSSDAVRAASASLSAAALESWSARSFSICATVLVVIVRVFSSRPGSKASPAGGRAPLA